MKTNLIKYFLAFAMIFTTFSCADLEVKNLNEPDTERVLVTPGDLVGLAGGSFRTWWRESMNYTGNMMAMETMADHATSSWGNSGMKDLSSEPRKGFNNLVTYGSAYVNRDVWNKTYSALSSVNDVLKKIDEGAVIDNADKTGMVKAWCHFMQGCTHSTLALDFDKANIIDETTDLATITYVGYQEVSAAAVGYFEKAIADIDATADFVLPQGFINGATPTSAELRQLANTMAARTMALTPRNKTENAAVDWGKVKSFAQNGLDYSFEVTSGPSWWDDTKWFVQDDGWSRVDYRIINLFDHSYPSRWPDDNASWTNSSGVDPEDNVNTSDARFASDFTYVATVPFKPDRGYYHFSHFSYSRWSDWLVTQLGPVPSANKWENALYEAEAEARSGSLANAIAILNDPAGNRKSRGGLADISASASKSEVLAAIFYERDIDLFGIFSGIAFCDMRRRDMLQRGTILHFPVPGAELEITGTPWYTINGAPDGINIAMEGWAGYDGLTSPTDWTAPSGWTPGQ